MKKILLSRIAILGVFVGLLGAVIIGKLFYLQIIKHSYYASKAQEGHLGYSEIEPRRGEILIKDFHSGEIFRLATNATFYVLYADPALITDPVYIADKLAPLIFDKDHAKEQEQKKIRLARYSLPDKPNEEILKSLVQKTDDELFQQFKADLIQKISQKTRPEIILLQKPDETLIKKITSLNITGIVIAPEALKALPPQITDPEFSARLISPLIDIPFERLSELLKGRNRYAVLHSKLNPSITNQIKKIIEEDSKAKKKMFSGIGFQDREFRFYPEGSLASQILGFSAQGKGLYGIESRFDSQLRGKKGVFRTQLDATGRQITVGDDIVIETPVDGDTITLTLDRSVQLEAEKLLAQRVKDTKADSGLVIIMEPSTGKIISMAQYPNFNPNEFGKALDTQDFELTKEEQENLLEGKFENGEKIEYLVLDRDSNYRIRVFKKVLENGKIIFEKYKNLVGPGAYLNRAVAEIFEPGSIFKVIAMGIALDSGDVTPRTTYNDTGPIKVDEYEIHNSLDTYYGIATMTTVIEKSLNTGMAFVARKIGRDLFYRYLKRFGFGERTDIEFDGEQDGRIKEGSRWAESELVTYAFGQGLAVTPIQMITAVSALANGGVLMQPYIIDSIKSAKGKTAEIQPRPIRRVIEEKTSATISAMMVNAVENGATRAQVRKHYVAGKTGTAQTYKHGKPLTGPGTTIASFVGFGPIDKPKFAILVKIDRPRTTIWGEAIAGPLFSQIADFLFRYYNVPPDKK